MNMREHIKYITQEKLGYKFYNWKCMVDLIPKRKLFNSSVPSSRF